ncbi:MAG: polymorphic toxin-type HINT domain-containing protein, partial [Proteobacteria bacterium]|nr:polymorphic toxin-type HINT domain-containing protein [Pseudomonadota bacterium]
FRFDGLESYDLTGKSSPNNKKIEEFLKDFINTSDIPKNYADHIKSQSTENWEKLSNLLLSSMKLNLMNYAQTLEYTEDDTIQSVLIDTFLSGNIPATNVVLKGNVISNNEKFAIPRLIFIRDGDQNSKSGILVSAMPGVEPLYLPRNIKTRESMFTQKGIDYICDHVSAYFSDECRKFKQYYSQSALKIPDASLAKPATFLSDPKIAGVKYAIDPTRSILDIFQSEFEGAQLKSVISKDIKEYYIDETRKLLTQGLDEYFIQNFNHLFTGSNKVKKQKFNNSDSFVADILVLPAFIGQIRKWAETTPTTFIETQENIVGSTIRTLDMSNILSRSIINFKSISAVINKNMIAKNGFYKMPTNYKSAANIPLEEMLRKRTFCFTGDILVSTANHAKKQIKDINLGEKLDVEANKLTQKNSFIQQNSYDILKIDSATWKEVFLIYSERINNKDYQSEIRLLRPIEWLREHEVDKIGNQVILEIPEFNLKQKLLEVRDIKDINFEKNLQENDAGVVIGVFKRYTEDVKTYSFIDNHGVNETLSATPGHMFFVDTKDDFIPLYKIKEEDKLLTNTGRQMHLICPDKNDCGTPYTKKNEPVAVYNLEVYSKHIYKVGHHGILVHNMMCGNRSRYYESLKHIVDSDEGLGEIIGSGAKGIVVEDLEHTGYVMKTMGYGSSSDAIQKATKQAELFNKYYGFCSAEVVPNRRGLCFLRMKKIQGIKMSDVPKESYQEGARDALNKMFKKLEDLDIKF